MQTQLSRTCSKLISLEFVRMALKRASYLRNTRAVALSTQHRPMRGRGTDLLHGECVIQPLL